MTKHKQDGRLSKKGGDKKKRDQQQPKAKHKTNWTLARKERNVKRHLARDVKRAENAKKAATPHGMARLERRRLERLVQVEREGFMGLE